MLEAAVMPTLPPSLIGVPPVIAPPVGHVAQASHVLASDVSDVRGGTSSNSGGGGGAGGAGLKCNVVITSYEVLREDLTHLKGVGWRYLVVDEAHRLKNAESALVADLRTLQVKPINFLVWGAKQAHYTTRAPYPF